ncbi:putative membrane protein YfcA [Algoriphagus sp. 4150]|uniref:sulfite exporter TauE/SafE family protein n=1 Tax=Algoriphagus sp. 4150 TaxID=2817756 RepID=UPI00285D30DE|nr:sulfite exporter TauE/SafE family protein [Algoriphagus sp. 4150]MDR7129766.1 putative membrane protein YfcA [Algoriphagus sp. 4150]
MEIIIISLAAFITAVLTFFSGFGLGTILTPVFVLFFPIDLAIALTGVVHFFNNVFKLVLVGKNADKKVLIRFGIPAVLAAIIGALILLNITDLEPLFTYQLAGNTFEVTPVKFIISIILIFFSIIEILPFFEKLEFGSSKLPLGGVLSGFFGGLSGHQGALRSAFLIKAGLSKEAFIGTSVVIACFIDFTRLAVYASRFGQSGLGDNLTLVICATLSAIAGAYLGNKLLKKITLKFLQQLVAIMLLLISIALGAGFI